MKTPDDTPVRPVRTNPSPLDAHLGFWLRFVSNRVSGAFRESVEACGVSVADWVALRTLYDQPEATHGTLTLALGMTKGAVSKLVSRLETKRLVTRDGHPADARLVVLHLTPAGRALVPRLAAIADQNDARFFGHLPEPRRRALRDVLESIVRTQGLQEVPTN